jgi:hypothetical protein
VARIRPIALETRSRSAGCTLSNASLPTHRDGTRPLIRSTAGLAYRVVPSAAVRTMASGLFSTRARNRGSLPMLSPSGPPLPLAIDPFAATRMPHSFSHKKDDAMQAENAIQTADFAGPSFFCFTRSRRLPRPCAIESHRVGSPALEPRQRLDWKAAFRSIAEPAQVQRGPLVELTVRLVGHAHSRGIAAAQEARRALLPACSG